MVQPLALFASLHRHFVIVANLLLTRGVGVTFNGGYTYLHIQHTFDKQAIFTSLTRVILYTKVHLLNCTSARSIFPFIAFSLKAFFFRNLIKSCIYAQFFFAVLNSYFL